MEVRFAQVIANRYGFQYTDAEHKYMKAPPMISFGLVGVSLHKGFMILYVAFHHIRQRYSSLANQ